MKYVVIIEQAGDGCDHTIGCGVMVDRIEASSDADAARKVGEIVIGMESEEVKIAHARFFPASSEKRVDLAVYRRVASEARAANEEQRELAELARLQAKYGRVEEDF